MTIKGYERVVSGAIYPKTLYNLYPVPFAVIFKCIIPYFYQDGILLDQHNAMRAYNQKCMHLTWDSPLTPTDNAASNVCFD